MANTTKPQGKILSAKIMLFIAGIGAVGGCVGAFFSLGVLLSFEVGFLGFLGIVGSSFANVLKRVKAQNLAYSNPSKQQQEACTQADKNTESPTESHTQSHAESSAANAESSHNAKQDSKENQPKGVDSSFSSRLVLGTQISFSLLRLLGYITFGAAVIVLLHFGLFAFVGFFAGLACALLVAVMLGMRLIRDIQKAQALKS